MFYFRHRLPFHLRRAQIQTPLRRLCSIGNGAGFDILVEDIVILDDLVSLKTEQEQNIRDVASVFVTLR